MVHARMLRREGLGGVGTLLAGMLHPSPAYPDPLYPITHPTPAAVGQGLVVRACVRVRARTERAEVTRRVVDLPDGREVPVGAARAARDAGDEERRVRALHGVCSGYARGVLVGMKGSRAEERRSAVRAPGVHEAYS